MIEDKLDLDLDFTFKEVETMKSIPWYKTAREIEKEEEK